MIIIKVLNQKIVYAAFTSQSSNQILSSILSTRNQKQLYNITRTLVQSNRQNQKVSKPDIVILFITIVNLVN